MWPHGSCGTGMGACSWLEVRAVTLRSCGSWIWGPLAAMRRCGAEAYGFGGVRQYLLFCHHCCRPFEEARWRLQKLSWYNSKKKIEDWAKLALDRMFDGLEVAGPVKLFVRPVSSQLLEMNQADI